MLVYFINKCIINIIIYVSILIRYNNWPCVLVQTSDIFYLCDVHNIL